MTQESRIEKEQIEELYRKYKKNSLGASIFYVLLIVIAVLTFMNAGQIEAYSTTILITSIIFLSLFVVFFVNSYKTRYVFFKRINKLEKVEYKITPLAYLLICIPFLLYQDKKMNQELKSLSFN